MVVVLNKWDLVPEKETSTMKQYEENIKNFFFSCNWISVLFTNALEGKRISKVQITPNNEHAILNLLC